MVSIMDLAPYVCKVKMCGVEIEMTGLPAQDFAELLREYPTLRGILDGAWKRGGVTVDAKQLFTEVPGAVHEIVAWCLADKAGAPHDAVVAKVASFGAGEQLALLRGALEATMPEGPGPFADGVASILGGSWGKPSPIEEPLPGGMTVSDASAPPPLSGALVLDMTTPGSGNSHRVNSSPSVN